MVESAAELPPMRPLPGSYQAAAATRCATFPPPPSPTEPLQPTSVMDQTTVQGAHTFNERSIA